MPNSGRLKRLSREDGTLGRITTSKIKTPLISPARERGLGFGERALDFRILFCISTLILTLSCVFGKILRVDLVEALEDWTSGAAAMADQDVTEQNRVHWDAAASKYNTHNSAAMDDMISEIRSRLDWIGIDFLDSDDEDERDDELAEADEKANADEVSGDQRTVERKSVRLLDYACGTGMVSRAFSPYVSQTVGIDLSTNMAAEYNIRANAQGLSATEMAATVGNLLSVTDPHPSHLSAEKYFNFDLAVVGLGFHHFEDPVLAAARLAERLKVGGVLMVIDFLPHGNDLEALGHEGNGEGGSGSGHHHHHMPGSGHGHGHGHRHDHEHEEETESAVRMEPRDIKKAIATVQHHGFSEADIKSAFEKAGCGKDFGYEAVAKQVVFKSAEKTMRRSVFMARGTKE